MKMLGIVIKIQEPCFRCGGRGIRSYPVYHNDYEDAPCNACNGNGVITTDSILSFSDFKAMIKEIGRE